MTNINADVTTTAPKELTETSASRNANARTVQHAKPPLESASALLDGR